MNKSNLHGIHLLTAKPVYIVPRGHGVHGSNPLTARFRASSVIFESFDKSFSPTSRIMTLYKALFENELSDMYCSTVKLCQENKMKATNTWDPHLIDYMPYIYPNPAPMKIATTHDTHNKNYNNNNMYRIKTTVPIQRTFS